MTIVHDSPEGIYLAQRINKFNLMAQEAKDNDTYEQGQIEFDNIKREMSFLTVKGLVDTVANLDENGLAVKEKYFQRYFDWYINKKPIKKEE